MTETPSPFLVTVNGQDGPGISARLFGALAERGVEVDDVEQVRVHGRLLLCVEADMVPAEVEPVRALLAERFGTAGVQVMVEPLVEADAAVDDVVERHLVTLLAPEIDAATLETVTSTDRALRRQHRADRAAGVVSRCTATSSRWRAPTSTACGGRWPRPRRAARSMWLCRRPGCTGGPST